MNLSTIQEGDPLKRIVEKQLQTEELSPMDPPDAYNPPGLEIADIASFHPFLVQLCVEHKTVTEELNHFEKTLENIRENGPGRNASEGLSRFFSFIDDHLVPHHSTEDKFLFPLLRNRLNEKGNHSNGPDQRNAVDMMEDDHIKMLQIAAVSFNLIGMSSRLPNKESAIVVLDAGLEQGKTLIELLRLHIFREENILFPLANDLLSKEELGNLQVEAKKLHH